MLKNPIKLSHHENEVDTTIIAYTTRHVNENLTRRVPTDFKPIFDDSEREPAWLLDS